MTATTTTCANETACPAWCMKDHPATEPRVHQSATWRGYGLSLMIEQDGPAPTVFVGHGVHDGLSDLTADQAHELGMALVRAADVLRRSRTETGS